MNSIASQYDLQPIAVQPVSRGGQGNDRIEIHFLLGPGFASTDLAFAVDTLEAANRILGRECYRWSLGAWSGSSAVSATGFVVAAGTTLDSRKLPDIVVLLGSLESHSYLPPGLLDRIRYCHRHNVSLGAVGSAVTAVASSGVLIEQALAVHPDLVDAFRERYPMIGIAPASWAIERRCLSSIGGISTLNLFLALLSERFGRRLADAVARHLNHTMDWSSSKFVSASPKVSSLVRRTKNRKLKGIVETMAEHTEEPVDQNYLSDCAGISVRQIQRLFRSHFGTSPRRFYIDLRLSKAKRLIEQTGMPVTEVGMASGFVSTSHFTACFASRFGCSPTVHRAKGRMKLPVASGVEVKPLSR